MSCTHLLQIGVSHGESACNRAAIIGSDLIDVRMDATIVRREIQVRLQERAVGLVEFACLNDLLADRMLVRIEKTLGKAWLCQASLELNDVALFPFIFHNIYI